MSFSVWRFQPAAVAGLRWRLFDFGSVDAEVKQARGANAQALLNYRQTVLHAAEDVENALTSLAETQAYVAELQAEVQALTKARDLSQDAYSAGAITLTDALDEDRQLLAAQDQLDANRADAGRAAVRRLPAESIQSPYIHRSSGLAQIAVPTPLLRNREVSACGALSIRH